MNRSNRNRSSLVVTVFPMLSPLEVIFQQFKHQFRIPHTKILPGKNSEVCASLSPSDLVVERKFNDGGGLLTTAGGYTRPTFSFSR